MIEPRMATMLGCRDDGCEGRAGAAAARADARSTDVTFNAITVDGECSTNDCVFALAYGASGVDHRATTIRPVRRGAAAGVRAARARDRARRRRRDQAGHGRGDRRPRPTSRRGGRRARSPTRRSSRPRSTAAIRTGDASSRWPGGPASTFDARSRARADRRRASCSPADGRTTSAPPQARDYLQDKDVDVARRPRHRRSGTARDVDVRPQRRVREDQRGVPNMSAPAAVTGRAVDLAADRQFLSDARSDAGRARGAVCELAASMKAARRAGRPHATPLAGRTSRCCSRSRRCARARRS